jgi:hypothetical protein
MHRLLSPINPASIPIRPLHTRTSAAELSRTGRTNQTLLVDIDSAQTAPLALDARPHCECLCIRDGDKYR